MTFRVMWQFAGPGGRWHDLADYRNLDDAIAMANRIKHEEDAAGNIDRYRITEDENPDWSREIN